MFEKALDRYPFTLEDVPNHYKTQEMCEKARNRYTYIYGRIFRIGIRPERSVKVFFDMNFSC